MMFFPWDDGCPPLLSAGGGGRKEEAKDYSYVFDALPHAGSSYFLLDTLSSLDSRPPLCISYGRIRWKLNVGFTLSWFVQCM